MLARLSSAALRRPPAGARSRHTAPGAEPSRGFSYSMLRLGPRVLRVGPRGPSGRDPPMLPLTGIGGNTELLGPIARRRPRRELLSFDIPGVGHSPLPNRPYRLPDIARLGAEVLAHFGHERCDVLGISW